MSTVKFCKDCRWCVVNNPAAATCHRPLGVHRDLVFGKERSMTNLTDCEYEREGVCWDRCGYAAKFFEPKEQPDEPYVD